MTSEISTKTIGIILEALALPILIIVAVLLNLPDKDLGAITVLLAFGVCTCFTGMLLHYAASASPARSENKEEKER